MKKKIEVKNKLINLIMLNGNKKTSEKILLKSIKKLQKDSLKQSEKIFQLAIVNSTPVFKLHKQQIKKRKKKTLRETPAFVATINSRTALAIKLVLSSNIKSKKSSKFFEDFKKEIFLISQQKGTVFELKNYSQKQVLLKKHLFAFYRWK